MDVARIYIGSDGKATRELYDVLEGKGPVGIIAMNLFRACKNNARAKVYRGGVSGRGSFRRMAYGRKQWSMGNLCEVLSKHAPSLGIKWGWKTDPKHEYHAWVLYIETPAGQISFHSDCRGDGPDFDGDWDGQHLGAERIIKWVSSLI